MQGIKQAYLNHNGPSMMHEIPTDRDMFQLPIAGKTVSGHGGPGRRPGYNYGTTGQNNGKDKSGNTYVQCYQEPLTSHLRKASSFSITQCQVSSAPLTMVKFFLI
jgi:membrane protein involved in colicin uptake